MAQQRNYSLNGFGPLLLISISCLLTLKNGFSQGIVNVNTLTGTAVVNIPIYNVKIGDLSSPVSLAYSASGLKVEDYDNSFGQGWRLIASASITREVRGFPDEIEYQGHSSFNTIYGWLKSANTAPQSIQSLTLANNGTGVCADEITDANTIASNYSYSYDTEPDQFNVSAPGLSCRFVFDGSTNHTIKIMPYRDYKITYTMDGAGRINAFTVVNENGIKYYFDKTNLMDHYIEVTLPGSTTEINPANLEAFKRDFLMYRRKDGNLVRYHDEWALSKMEDTRGNQIRYSYGNYTITNPEILKRYSYKEMEIFKPDGSGGFTRKALYGVTTARIILHLQSITTYSMGMETGSFFEMVQFGWATPSGSNEDERLSTITLTQEKKIYELLYTKKFLGSQSVWYGYGRYFLKGLRSYKPDNLCAGVTSQFDFSYYEVNEALNTCYCVPTVPGNPGATTDTIINAQDYWGYFNAAQGNTSLNPEIYVYPDNSSVELFKLYPIPGVTGVTLTSPNDRTVNIHARDGTLKRITYPNGAITELEYENNEFYDNDVNGNVKGGGIRVKKITDNDGLNTISETFYEYNDPASTSQTTGRAVSVPKFTLAFPNSTTYGNSTDRVFNSTYRTPYDLNTEPEEILYGKVTEKKTGEGKTVYEYNTSGTFRSAAVNDWQETMNYIARNNLGTPPPCPTIAPNFLNSGTLQYPFAPHPNFDFERGLLTKITHYNEAGNVIANEDYAYDRSHQSPSKVYGLRLDQIGTTIEAYGKYFINTEVDNFLVTKTTKVYNSTSPSSTVYTQEVQHYVYTDKNGTPPYRLLKEVWKENSDGATSISRFKYAKEYTATGSGDAMDTAIYNFNNTTNQNPLIETTQGKMEGSVEKTIGASLNTFRAVTIGDLNATNKTAYLPYASYQFIKHDGITGFVPSYINSGGNFIKDNNYVNTPVAIETYNPNGIPQLMTDNSRIPKTVISSIVNEIKLAEFSNARPENTGFSNFEIPCAVDFTIGSGALVSGGRYSNYCLNFQPSTSLCRVLTKPATAANMIVSFWLKDAQSAGEISICATSLGCNLSNCSSSPAVSFSAGSQWKYYQVKIPYANKFGVTTFTYILSTSVAVKLDDLIIYPDNSSVAAYSYTSNSIAKYLLTAKTGINGIGNSYEYDNAGRLWLVRDQFDNIVEMKKYKLINYEDQPTSIVISRSASPYTAGVAGNFGASLPFGFRNGDCSMPPIVYTFNFGDGRSNTTANGDASGDVTVQHTYTNTGTYQITVTASSPEWTNIVAQTPPVTNTPPAELPVTVVGQTPSPCSGGGGTPVICAAGITEYTSAHQCVLSNCSPMSSSCTVTNFRLTAITNGSLATVKSVVWEIAPYGTSDWSTWQTQVEQPVYETSRLFHVIHTVSYLMRAKIIYCDTNLPPAYSNSIAVLNDN